MAMLSKSFGRQGRGFHTMLTNEFMAEGDWIDPNAGWKMHLSVPLDKLEDPTFHLHFLCNSLDLSHKIGGGMAGKNMTVYLGSWDDLIEFRDYILEEVPNLPAIDGTALEGDLLLGDDRVAARFDPYTTKFPDPYWGYGYGQGGLPFGDIRKTLIPWGKTKFPAAILAADKRDVHQRFCRDYGEDYYGDTHRDRFEEYLGLQPVLSPFSCIERAKRLVTSEASPI